MANEISYQFQILLNNLGVTDSFSTGSQVADQTTNKIVRNVQTVGFAADEALDLGSVTTPRWSIFQNNDDTNFIQIGVGSFTPFLELDPGDFNLVRLATAAPRAQADTGAVDLFYIMYDE